MENLLQQFLATERLLPIVRAFVILIGGVIAARVVAAGLYRVMSVRLTPQQAMLGRRLVLYTIVGLTVASVLNQLGFQLSVLLGAAGILTVAIGFASQTSASNLISGLFLIGERPFVVGDAIRVDDVTGEVLSIDLLSTKIRTFDNLYVRVPNESIIKTRVTNFTHLPIRRIDIPIGVAYKEDAARVEKLLLEIADRNVLCLTEPEPIFMFKGFADSSLDLQLSVWTKRENFLAFRTALHREIKETFDREGIEIPFPHVSLYAGSATAPFPVRVTGD